MGLVVSGKIVNISEKSTSRGAKYFSHLVLDDAGQDARVYAVSADVPLTTDDVQEGVPVSWSGLYSGVPTFRAIEEAPAPAASG